MSEILNHSEIVSESSPGTQKTRKGLNFQTKKKEKKSVQWSPIYISILRKITHFVPGTNSLNKRPLI